MSSTWTQPQNTLIIQCTSVRIVQKQISAVSNVNLVNLGTFQHSTIIVMLAQSYFISDVRELIHIDDVMEDEDIKLGPNGGLIFCLE